MSNLYVLREVIIVKQMYDGERVEHEHPFITKYEETDYLDKVVMKRSSKQDHVERKARKLVAGYLCVEIDGKLYKWRTLYE